MTRQDQIEFVDPYTKERLKLDTDGNPYFETGSGRVTYHSYDGVIDFTRPADASLAEQSYYDKQYSQLEPLHITLEEVRYHWFDDTRPENRLLLESLGDVSGKRVLLLGNGTSVMELYLLVLGADVIFTDFSLAAVRFMRRNFLVSRLRSEGYDRIQFHAVDALHLPFPDSSIDVVYGCAFAHHIEHLDRLLAEVKRCLRPGGICRFMDGAYSPLWQFTKGTFLRPLQLYVHKKRGISPADVRATRRGGYRREELAKLGEDVGMRDLVYIRTSFFLYIARRGLGKLIGWDRSLFRRARPVLLFAKWLDRVFARLSIFRENRITLIWGFTK